MNEGALRYNILSNMHHTVKKIFHQIYVNMIHIIVLDNALIFKARKVVFIRYYHKMNN